MLRKALAFIMGTPVKPTNHTSGLNFGSSQVSRQRELIRRESKIGATVLGAVPDGHTREFFCLDRHTWVWHEEWVDSKTNTPHLINVRYEIQPRGVLKTVNNTPRGYVNGTELTNLLSAMRTYHDRVAVEVYGRAPLAA